MDSLMLTNFEKFFQSTNFRMFFLCQGLNYVSTTVYYNKNMLIHHYSHSLNLN